MSGTVFTGKGIDVYAHIVLAQGLEGFAKFGMVPTRGMTGKKMLDLASKRLGRKFKARDYLGAAKALREAAAAIKLEPGEIETIGAKVE